MSAVRNFKQDLKIVVNQFIDQARSELNEALVELGDHAQLVTNKDDYEKLMKKVEISLNRASLMESIFFDDKQSIKNTTNCFKAKDADLWIINKNIHFSLDTEGVKRTFNAKKLEMALLKIKSELLERDLDRSENPAVDFINFCKQIRATLEGYANKMKDVVTSADPFLEKFKKMYGKLNYILTEAEKSVSVTPPTDSCLEKAALTSSKCKID